MYISDAWVRELVSFAAFAPIVWFLLKQNQNNFAKMLQDNREGFAQIVSMFKEHEKADHEQMRNLLVLLKEHGDEVRKEFSRLDKKYLNKEQAIFILTAGMETVSTKKLNFIKRVLIVNGIEGRRDFITEKIKNGLSSLSGEYDAVFATFNTAVGPLNEWLDKKFTPEHFEKFVEKIVEIMYKNDEIDNKLTEIALEMETLRVDLGNTLKKEIKDGY